VPRESPAWYIGVGVVFEQTMAAREKHELTKGNQREIATGILKFWRKQ